jgi:hypothetical protein
VVPPETLFVDVPPPITSLEVPSLPAPPKAESIGSLFEPLHAMSHIAAQATNIHEGLWRIRIAGSLTPVVGVHRLVDPVTANPKVVHHNSCRSTLSS